jgi:hypothetical protein
MRTEVGLHMNLVNSLVILGEAMTCSVFHPLRNCEYGLFKECLWFLEASTGLDGFPGGGSMGILTYLCEMLRSPAIFLEVLGTGVAKESCRTGSFIRTEARTFNLFSKVSVRLQWIWSIRKVSALGIPSERRRTEQSHPTCQGSRCHPLKSQSHDALGSAVLHKVVGLIERCGTCGAIIVDVDNGYSGHPKGI